MIEHLMCCLFGAFCQELAHWNTIKNNITQKKYEKLIKSRAYWIISALMILSSPIFLYLWNAGEFNQMELKDSLLYGISFPLILKKLGETGYKNHLTLGEGNISLCSVLKMYLRVS